jgi:hypothetical protein
VTPRRTVLAAHLLLTAAGCKEPTQYEGPIPVDQGAMTRRIRLLCHVVATGHAEARCGEERLVDGGTSIE